MDREVVFDLKAVGDIKGDFYVPSYQRGYRWGKTEVVRLLDDIYATGGKSNYCLQPIVLRRKDEKYEVVDGQQRLTTLYLIYRYMNINDVKKTMQKAVENIVFIGIEKRIFSS